MLDRGKGIVPACNRHTNYSTRDIMRKTAKLMAMLMALICLSLPFVSCSSSDEPDNSYYDYSIVWHVVDKGDYTTSAAQSLAAEFTEECEDMFRGYKESAVKEEFNEFCEQLRYELSTGYMKITLRAELVREEGMRVIATKTFFIDPDGTTIKKPTRAGSEVVVVVE